MFLLNNGNYLDAAPFEQVHWIKCSKYMIVNLSNNRIEELSDKVRKKLKQFS